MPMYIVKSGKGFYNNRTGRYLSEQEIESYRDGNEAKTTIKQSHESILSKRWDLNY